MKFFELDFEEIIEHWKIISPLFNESTRDECIRRLEDLVDDNVHHPLYTLLLTSKQNVKKDEIYYPKTLTKPHDRLKYIMRKHGLRQFHLVRAGLGNRVSVSRICNGKRIISKNNIIFLSKFFKCSVDVFFPPNDR